VQTSGELEVLRQSSQALEVYNHNVFYEQIIIWSLNVEDSSISFYA